MNIIVNIDKNTLANKQPKIYDLGEVTTSVQNLLDNSTIVITNDRLVVLRFIDLDLSVKQGFLNLNNYTEGDKYGLGQDILESDLIYFSSEHSGNFIPLSGTIDGNPVTGDVEFSGCKLILSTISGDVQFLDATSGNIIIHSDAYSVLVTASSGLDVQNGITSRKPIIIADEDLSSRGIVGNHDYSGNITDLDYTQKIYVD